MKRSALLVYILLSLKCFAGAYDIAEDFMDNKMYDDAKRETIKLIYSGKEEIKPEGYFILGKIDAAKGDYESARKNWIKLKELYPKSDFTRLAAERSAFHNISLYKDQVKDVFEVYSIKMGMSEKSFQDAKEDMKLRVGKVGIPTAKIKGEFVAGELYKLDMTFENYISFDTMKTISALSKIEALRSYIEGRVNNFNYNVLSSKSNDGRIYNIIITDRKIYAKKYQPELENNIDLFKRIEKEKIVPVKGVVDEEVLKALEDEERAALEAEQ